MKDQKRIVEYKGLEIVQTLRENKHEGDYDLFTDVAGIYNEMDSFAWQSQDKKERKIKLHISEAKSSIDRYIDGKENKYAKFGFKYVDEEEEAPKTKI